MLDYGKLRKIIMMDDDIGLPEGWAENKAAFINDQNVEPTAV
jgi:hypothetical protein